jgi:hypothetical protein
MEADDYQTLIDLTCWVRHLRGWEDGRRALREAGIDPDTAICTYLGPGGYAGCQFLLPGGRFVGVLIEREESTGRPYVAPEWTEEFEGQDQLEQMAGRIASSSGGLAEFGAAVRARYEREYAAREPVILEEDPFEEEGAG